MDGQPDERPGERADGPRETTAEPLVTPADLGDAAAPDRLAVIHTPARSGVQPWRERAGALRTSLPQLARNPVVVSASTVALTLAARLAVEVARRALAGSSAAAPVRLEVSGHVMHHVHVVQHVHVVHHTSSPIGWPALSSPPRR